ncbi:MAG: FecR domain-containing protein, partial [Sandaracinaceae bacterium]|nr:FecR domain-containing protein [Sandaracinaceae bacterium]
MSTRAEKYEALLDDLAPLVDGDPEALERHADFLADDDEARDLRHDAAAAAELLKRAGADYVPPADLEARLLAALDAQASGRTTSPGFAAPDELAKAQRVSGESPKAQEPAQDEPGQGQARGELGHAPTQPMPVTPAPVASDTAQPAAAAPKPAPKAEKRRKGNVVWLFPAAGIAAVAAAGLIGFALFGGETTTGGGTGGAGGGTVASAGGLSGTVEHVARAAEDGRTGIEIRRAGSDQFVSLAQGESVPNGAAIRTDDRTRARLGLSDGSTLVLNHATEVQLAGERAVQVRSGEVSADIAHLSDGPNATFETRNGTVEVLGTKFVLAATDDVTSVRVTRGVVSLRGASGEPARVHAGEEGLARPGAQPSVTPALDLAQSLSWSELTESVSQESEQALVGLGSLRARRPGEREARERPLSLARHTVRVRIVGNVARTEIEEVFRNDSNETLEGIYRFPLPADAQIARLALDVNGQMEEGSFVARDRAAAIWRGVIRNATPVSQRIQNEEFIWVPGPWTDPALLEWQRGGQFELRIFPIPAHGERRVILGYTQTVAPQAGGRRYVYPLAHSTDGSTEVGEFDVDVRVADAERVGTHGYPLEPGRDGEATTLRFRQQGFRPNGDLVVDYAQPGADRELSWWTYRGEAAIAPVENTRETDEAVLAEQRRLAGDGRGYVALALRPRLPAATMRRDRDYVVVIDSSQSMVGERFARANELASRVVGEMDRRDRFTMFACDHECRQLGGGMRTPGAEASREASDWLSRVEPA